MVVFTPKFMLITSCTILHVRYGFEINARLMTSLASFFVCKRGFYKPREVSPPSGSALWSRVKTVFCYGRHICTITLQRAVESKGLLDKVFLQQV